MEKADSKVYALVLAGGRSRRMGVDKAALVMPGRADQLTWITGLLAEAVEAVFVSVGHADERELPVGVQAIVDVDEGQGPMAGVLAAMEAYPSVAWLVVAVDMPLLEQEHLQALLAGRSLTRVASHYADGSGRVEPLCAVYEADCLSLLQQDYQRGQRSLARFLKWQACSVLRPESTDFLRSANTPEQWQALLAEREES